MTISQLEEAGIRKVATKVTTTLNCLEGAVQPIARKPLHASLQVLAPRTGAVRRRSSRGGRKSVVDDPPDAVPIGF